MIPKWHGSGDLLVYVRLALGRRPSGPAGPPLLSEHPNGTCDSWHAPHWWNSRIHRWAWVYVVGCQKERSRAHCCHVLPVCLGIQHLLRTTVNLRCVRDTLDFLSKVGSK